MEKLFLLLLLPFACGKEPTAPATPLAQTHAAFTRRVITDQSSWTSFLQNLPEKQGLVVDYRGKPVQNQEKQAALIDYDTGNRDLQQCADALMRLRAEYLFQQRRLSEIHFHFTSGHDYSFLAFCRGQRPLVHGNRIRFVATRPVAANHQSLRQYLNIVYAYAGTMSLAKELRNAEKFAIGTVIIAPGSPGHCLIISDEATTPEGETLYKLVEGYSPAQSIYVLRNVQEPSLGYWHRLRKGVLTTASYRFRSFQRKAFE